jgi:hypothetical protein
MRMPGFSAEMSLYTTGIQYGSTRVLVQAGGLTPQLFCRPTDCTCLYEQCRKAGGTVVPGPQPPCHYTCEVKPGCTCGPGETCCNPETGFCCPPGETCCNPETGFCCPSGQTCCSNPHKDSCCPPGQLCCDPATNSCADITTDPANCGSCGEACGPCQTCLNGQCTQLIVSYEPPQPPSGPGFDGTLTVQGQNFPPEITLNICNCGETYQFMNMPTLEGSFTKQVPCGCGPGGSGLTCNGPKVINQAVVMVTVQDASGNTLACGSAPNPC